MAATAYMTFKKGKVASSLHDSYLRMNLIDLMNFDH